MMDEFFDLAERLGRLSDAELDRLAYPWLHKIRAYSQAAVRLARLEQARRRALGDEGPVARPAGKRRRGPPGDREIRNALHEYLLAGGERGGRGA